MNKKMSVPPKKRQGVCFLRTQVVCIDRPAKGVVWSFGNVLDEGHGPYEKAHDIRSE